MQNRISIIIVNWNGKKWLKKCLDSLTDQTYKNFEVILVDNNSSDESLDFVKQHYPHVITVKSDKNLGFAGGNNLGIKHSTGDLILLLNNDTWFERDFLNKYVFEFITSECDIAAPQSTEYEYPSYNKYFWTIDLFGHPVYQKIDEQKKQKVFYLPGVCILFKRELYSTTGGLDNNFFMYAEEVDWFWRLHLLRKKCFQINDVFIYHAGAGSTGSGINANVFLWRNQNTLQMLIKNYKWFNLLWILPTYILQNLFEIVFFIIIFKPKISLSYIRGWWFNLVHIRRILKERKCIQKNRQVGDVLIMSKMFFGPGKLYHLINFFGLIKS